MLTIRPSSLVTYSDCSRRYAAHHLTDMVVSAGYTLAPSRSINVGAAVGGAVHAAAGYTMQSKRETGALGNDTEAIDRAEAEFDDRTQYGVSWDHTTDNISTAMKQITRMSKVYRRDVAPDLTPLLVEQRLTADVGDGWEISGQLDTLAGDPDNVVEDLKTGVSRRANGVQYATYAMLFRAHGYHVKSIWEDFIPRVPILREQPEAQRSAIELEPAMQDAWELIEGIKRDTTEFQKRATDPNGRSPMGAFRPNPQSVLLSKILSRFRYRCMSGAPEMIQCWTVFHRVAAYPVHHWHHVGRVVRGAIRHRWHVRHRAARVIWTASTVCVGGAVVLVPPTVVLWPAPPPAVYAPPGGLYVPGGNYWVPQCCVGEVSARPPVNAPEPSGIGVMVIGIVGLLVARKRG